MLNIDEMEALLDEITIKVTRANRMGELDDLLEKWGFYEFLSKSPVYDTEKNGK